MPCSAILSSRPSPSVMGRCTTCICRQYSISSLYRRGAIVRKTVTALVWSLLFIPLMGMFGPLTGIEEQAFTDIPASEHRVTLCNGHPGLAALDILVNGRVFSMHALQDNEERSI